MFYNFFKQANIATSFGSKSTASKIVYRIIEINCFGEFEKVGDIDHRSDLVNSLAYILESAFNYDEYRKLDGSTKNQIRNHISIKISEMIKLWDTTYYTSVRIYDNWIMWEPGRPGKGIIPWGYSRNDEDLDRDYDESVAEVGHTHSIAFPDAMRVDYSQILNGVEKENFKCLVSKVQEAVFDALVTNNVLKYLLFSFAMKDMSVPMDIIKEIAMRFYKLPNELGTLTPTSGLNYNNNLPSG